MASIPSWVWVILKIAAQLGSPWILETLKKLISGLPAELLDIINGLIGDIKNPSVPNKVARQSALAKLKKCQGVACAPEIKNDK